MDFREWALVAFTILSQVSVGAFIGLGVVHFLAARQAGPEQADRMTDRVLYSIGPVIALGMLASFAHLSNPLNAPRAIANFATSWLSREILMAVLFAGLGALFALLQWRKIGSFMVRNIVAGLAALAGVGLVISMGYVYMLNTQPAWNTAATPVLFLATAVLLGSLALGAALVANYLWLKRKDPGCAEVQCDLVRSMLRWITVVGVLAVGVELVTVPMQLAYLVSTGLPEAQASVALTFNTFGVLFVLRLLLAFLGAGVLGLFLYKTTSQAGGERQMGALIFSAFALVLVAEVMGRFLFYATHVQITL